MAYRRRQTVFALGCLLLPVVMAAQDSLSVTALYRGLASTHLDPAHVYRIRNAWVGREDIHISLDEGTIAFTQAVDGRITGALFEGEGELLVSPPDQVERWSVNVFTGAAVLDERFSFAYFRFNDDLLAELKPDLRPAPDAAEFLAKWDEKARELSRFAATRVLQTLVDARRGSSFQRDPRDRMLYARVLGTRLGSFDVFFDTKAVEQISIGQQKGLKGEPRYDIWTSFRMRSVREQKDLPADPWRIKRYRIHARIVSPTDLEAETTVELEASEDGERFLIFELSRYLRVREVVLEGCPLEFLQNEAIEGTDLAQRGNDLVGVVLPEPLKAGERLQLSFVYGGPVLSEAGGGLMYVGARGIWYPNRGMVPADFDLEFRYPASWTLVATGKRIAVAQAPAVAKKDAAEKDAPQMVARYISECPIPVAGFNLGQYVKATAEAGGFAVESYAARGVEDVFPTAPPEVVVMPPSRRGAPPQAITVVPPSPQPASNAQAIADSAVQAASFLSQRLGPYPFQSLALTQMPGVVSQGWPGLVFLSSYVFVTPKDRIQAKLTPFQDLVFSRVMLAHEVAHQWWGDLVTARTYRDTWLLEALSNYSALRMLSQNELNSALVGYRSELLKKDQNGLEELEAGPVTLGYRLNSSRFPNSFNSISYGRGSWLLHMLDSMFRDAQPEVEGDPFWRVSRKLYERFAGREISTSDLQKAFEEELPKPLWFEGKRSLDWFFEGWVDGTSIPKLTLTGVKFTVKGGRRVASGKVMQQSAAARLVTSVPIYAVSRQGPFYLGRVFADGAETPFHLNVPASTRQLLLDPFDTVLKR